MIFISIPRLPTLWQPWYRKFFTIQYIWSECFYACKLGRCLFNPIDEGRGHNVPALFSDGYFSMKKGVWRSKISWLFLIHYELSENQKIFFLVFHSVLRWSRRCGLIQPPPPLSSNIQEPRSIRVKCWKCSMYSMQWTKCQTNHLNPNRAGLLDVAWERGGAESARTF